MWRVGAVLGVALVAGCSGLGEDAGGSYPPEAPAPPGELAGDRCTAFQREALRVTERTREELSRRLGEPLRVETATEPNRHLAGATDTIRALQWDGFEARIRTAGGRDLLESVTVRENRHLRYGAPAIGSAEREVLELLGEPDTREEERLEYLCAEEPIPDMPVQFELEAGAVRQIVFHYYVD